MARSTYFGKLKEDLALCIVSERKVKENMIEMDCIKPDNNIEKVYCTFSNSGFQAGGIGFMLGLSSSIIACFSGHQIEKKVSRAIGKPSKLIWESNFHYPYLKSIPSENAFKGIRDITTSARKIKK